MSCFAPSSPAHDPTTSQMQVRANVARRKLESKEAAKATTAPALKNSASDTSAAPAPKNLASDTSTDGTMKFWYCLWPKPVTLHLYDAPNPTCITGTPAKTNTVTSTTGKSKHTEHHTTFSPKCGKENTVGGAFCAGCGTKLSQKVEVQL